MAVLCYKCDNFKNGKYVAKCVECFTPRLYPIDPFGCKMCAKPTEYEYCWSCNHNFINGQFRLTDLIPITYNTKSDDLTFLLIGLKNKGYQDRLMGLVSTLNFFLTTNYKKICNAHGGIDYVTYVPSIDGRNHCHQMLKMASEIGDVGFSMVNLLEQTKPIPKHKGTPAETRVLYQDCFDVINHSVEGKNILLFDDVFTTGSTLSSAAHALFNKGANKVIGLVLARVIGGEYEIEQAEALKANAPFDFSVCKYDHPWYGY